MALPLAIPALGLGGKLAAALKLLKVGKTAKLGMGAYKALKGAGVPKAAARFAGDKLHKVSRGLTSFDGFKSNLGIPMTKNDIAMAVAPDLLFGGLSAATTEGDIIDKGLAGLGSAAGGIAGGVGLRGVLGPKSGMGILGTELVGGMLGDQVGYGMANSIIRSKHGGMTPMEQRMADEEENYKRQLYDQFLAGQGLA